MPSSVGEIITLEPGWDEEDTTEGIVNEQKDLTIETLHEHALEHVITKLDQQDLCNFSQASKPIKAKTSRPKFWQLIKVSKTKIQQEGLPKLFLIEKYKQVQRIDLSSMNFTDKELIVNLRAIAASSVVELDLEGVRVYKVPKELLAKLARQLTKIDLSESHPTTEQCVALLQACVPPATMTQVNLGWCFNLREVPVDLLVKALGHLVQINLNLTRLTPQQYLAVVQMCTASPSLVELSLRVSELADVPPQILEQAARRLTKIDLSYCDLTTDQCISVLNACIASTTLNHVDISGNDLQQVPAEQLANAVGNLESVELEHTMLITEQCTAVLEKCKSSKLTHVDLSVTDLNQVTPQLLEEAIRSVQRMRLMHAKVTSEQRIGILNAVFTSSVTVHMYLSDDKKASLPDGLFIQAKGTGRLLVH